MKSIDDDMPDSTTQYNERLQSRVAALPERLRAAREQAIVLSDAKTTLTKSAFSA
jgi:hypothetical protein